VAEVVQREGAAALVYDREFREVVRDARAGRVSFVAPSARSSSASCAQPGSRLRAG
jgi:hypothetical protein